MREFRLLLCSLFMFLIGGIQVWSQTQNSAFNADLIGSYNFVTGIRSSSYGQIFKNVSAFDIYDIDARSIYSFVKQAGRTKEFTLQLPGEQLEFTLWENDLRSGNYILKVSTPNGDVERGPAEVTTYKGYLNGDENNRVRIAIRDGYMSGIFFLNSIEYSLQPANVYVEGLSSGQFILYKTEDLVAAEGVVCDASLKGSVQKMIGNPDKTASSQAWVCAELAMAADYAFYQIHGANTETVLREILNLVQDFYDQLEIQYKLTGIYIDEANQQTWTSSTYISKIMPAYRDWAHANFPNPFDLTTLWTGVNIYGDDTGSGSGLIGRALLGQVCTANNFQICEYYPPWGKDNTRHRVNMAHEVGHTWGGNHVSGCAACIMAPGLDGFNNKWSSTSVSAIQGGKTKSCIAAGQCSFTDPPQAAFTSDQTDGCGSLTVQFTDNSTYNPTSWLWDFGDGNTSTEQNPMHTYAAPGNYTVTLKATNQYGDHTETKTDLIRLGAGDPFPATKGGPADNTFGEGAYFSATNVRRLLFDVHEDVIIESVKVYADQAGERSIEILDNASNQVFVKSVDIPVGESRVQLDAAIPAGTNYAIKVASSLVNLYRNSNGPSYPYAIDGMVTILKTDAASTPEAATQYYYFFYDWAVRKRGCTTTSTGVELKGNEITIYPNPVADLINIEMIRAGTTNAEIKLYNLIGEVVYEKSLGTISGVLEHQINSGDLPSGNYLLFIKAGDKVISKKIMKE